MSFVTSIKFTVLSSASSETEIFNCLVPVKRHDTGEEGILLCSHYCKWPASLVPQATWLEGCFTPKRMKDDPRLLMGYHPKHLVSWSYDLETKVVELKLHDSGGQDEFWDGDGDGDGDEFLNFPLPYNGLRQNTRLYRWIDRVFSSALVEGDDDQSGRDVFALAVRLLEQKRIDHSVLLGLASWLQDKVNSNVHCFMGEWFCEVVAEPVAMEIDEEDFYEELVSPINLSYEEEEPIVIGSYSSLPFVGGEVVLNLEPLGFKRAETLPYRMRGEVLEVIYDTDNFSSGKEIPYLYEEGEGLLVTEEYYLSGWGIAVPLVEGGTLLFGGKEWEFRCFYEEEVNSWDIREKDN